MTPLECLIFEIRGAQACSQSQSHSTAQSACDVVELEFNICHRHQNIFGVSTFTMKPIAVIKPTNSNTFIIPFKKTIVKETESLPGAFFPTFPRPAATENRRASTHPAHPRIPNKYFICNSITAMSEYKHKSFEELRFEDYTIIKMTQN